MYDNYEKLPNITLSTHFYPDLVKKSNRVIFEKINKLEINGISDKNWKLVKNYCTNLKTLKIVQNFTFSGTKKDYSKSEFEFPSNIETLSLDLNHLSIE